MNGDDHPSGRPKDIEVPHELREVSSRLRQAMHRGDWAKRAIPKLEEFARALKARLRSTREEIFYLLSLCLQAEIHDYYGNYDLARQALKEDGPLLEDMLNGNELGVVREEMAVSNVSKALMRQQLWTLVFYAHCFYRDGRYKEALRLLNDIQKQLDGKLPLDPTSNPDAPSYGLRARVCYSRGQVQRQMSDIPKVRKEFMDAIEFTRQRLLAKMKAYSGPGEEHARARLREQRYANYFLAKANCFGLAWASYNSGELGRASASAAAGCVLLAATEDDVHTAYAQVMYAQILTAKTPPVEPGQSIPPTIQQAFAILEDLVESPESVLRTIPKFLARAQYALVGALFASGQYDKAEALAKTIYRNTETEEGSRWHLESVALLIRILLKQGNIDEARDYSDKFLDLTKGKTDSPNARAEAWLCRAEFLLKTKTSLDEIDEALTEAQILWETNPLSTTICHLHRARLYVQNNNPSAARRELAFWKAAEPHIEQAYVRELARSVEAEIAGFDDNLLLITPQDLQPEMVKGVRVWGFARAERKLKRWALGYLYSLYGEDYLNNGNPQRILNRSDRTIREWQKDLEFYPGGSKEEDGES